MTQNQNTRIVKARCTCGAAAHEITFPKVALPIQAAFCHCTSCRHTTGSLCITCTPVVSSDDNNEDEYQPTSQLLEKLTCFESSKDRINYYFCSVCGTYMLARVFPNAEQERHNHNKNNRFARERWLVTCGTLEHEHENENDEIYYPRHEYLADTINGGIANLLSPSTKDGSKRIERWPRRQGDGEELPSPLTSKHSNSPARMQTKPDENDDEGNLHAHCKCHSVEFWIARPTTANGLKYKATACPCNDCQFGNGMEWFVSAGAQVPLNRIFLDEDGCVPFQQQSRGFDTLKLYRSSSSMREKGFCGVCGAAVFLAGAETDEMRVAVGLFDAAEGARAERWLNWSDWTGSCCHSARRSRE